MARERADGFVDLHQFEWRAFVEVPHLIRQHAMPPAVRTLDEQEVDRRHRRARAAGVTWCNDVRRAKHLAEEAALRVRLEAKGADQLLRASVHFITATSPRRRSYRRRGHPYCVVRQAPALDRCARRAG